MLFQYRCLSILGLVWAGSLTAQFKDPFLRYPSIRPDGQTLAFSYQGDIWTVPAKGGRALRLTLNQAYESRPLWSPDGQHLAFNSDRHGNNDIFVTDAQGSTPLRLTYHSRPDTLSGWTSDGKILFNTTRHLPFNWEAEIYSVPQAGGTPTRMTQALGKMPRMSPNGRLIAFVRGAAKDDRKRYLGPANLEIWIWNTKSDDYHQVTEFDGNDFRPIWASNHQLLFISEADGIYNLYRIGIQPNGRPSSAPQQLTQFKEDGVRYFDVANNGTIVFEKDTHIYLLPPDGQPSKVNVTVPGDSRFLAQTTETLSSGATELAIGPKEDFLSVVVRGEIFLVKNDPKKSRTVRLTNHSFRDRDIQYHGEHAVIFASDRMGGQYDLFGLTSAEPDQPSLYQTLSFQITRLTNTESDERNPVISPNGEHIVFSRADRQLIVAQIDEDHQLGKETLLHEGWNVPRDVVWSPDSRWLAYTQQNIEFNAEIFIHAADGAKGPINVTYHPRVDHSPFWSQDGSKLGFISSRNNGDDDIWFVWLKRADWEKTQEDWDEDEESEPAKPNAKEKEKTEPDKEKETPKIDTLVIDFEGIHDRLSQVTSLPGNETELVISKDGETFYFVANEDNRKSFDADQDVFQIKWNGTELKKLTSGGKRGGRLAMGPSFKYLYFVQNQGKLSRIDLKKSKKEGLKYRAKMTINHVGERQQVFNEAWRALNLNFYDPQFHGVDWEALGKKYKVWALKASTNQDFQDVFNMLLGELNASHVGLRQSDRYETASERTGRLGIEIVPVNDGVRVTKVLAYGPSDREAGRLAVGDVITGINHQKISKKSNFYRLLQDTSAERLRLTVRNNKGVVRVVVIRPSQSIRNQTYREFVDSRRKMVAQLSKSRLGYVHVRGMNWSSYEAFERALTAEGDGKDGLVIDVRYNGGGWTTDYLLAVLSVRQHAYTIPRGASENLQRDHHKFSTHYPYGERLPMAGWPHPAITICNQFSYSNAEIFAHAFQSLDRGTLVGAPTFGAVISTGGVGLLGGAFVRMPFRGWFVKKTGKNMELGPAVPDKIVVDPPGALLKGQDPQLKVAVETLLSEIDGN